MGTPPDWLTPEDVAAYLDLPTADDDNLILSTAAIKASLERRRSDLWKGDPPVFTPDDGVKGGAVMWAAMVWQWRSSPSGPPGFGDETMVFDALGSRRAEIMRMVGWRRPVAV